METIKDTSIGDIVQLTSSSSQMIYVGKDETYYYFKPVDGNYDRYNYIEFKGQQRWYWSIDTIERLGDFKIIQKNPVINEQEAFDDVFKLLTKVIKSI
jgi:hypothetical protein